MPRGGKRPGAGRKPGSKKKAGVSSARAVPVSQPEEKKIDNPFGLEVKQLLFVELYTGVCKFNASEAYKQAGYKPNRHNAARLITDENVARAIEARLAPRLRALQMSGDEALEGISRIGRLDFRKLYDTNGDLIPLHKLDDETADCIETIENVVRVIPGTRGREVERVEKIKFYNKLDARKTMAKAGGKLRDKVDLKITRGLEDILAEVNELERQGAGA